LSDMLPRVASAMRLAAASARFSAGVILASAAQAGQGSTLTLSLPAVQRQKADRTHNISPTHNGMGTELLMNSLKVSPPCVLVGRGWTGISYISISSISLLDQRAHHITESNTFSR
jgi:hypothetical protein